ncbi:MAG: phosphoribosylanthranilate isomerase [Desulfonauticus sp.]|jgi:phosphoribosylanthranilate isomerase|nr:MAG: N-(5'-phosphoribosyl)anthranilate isomerase [Desulfonauticus sp. 38_4375]MDK2922311.1 phosphoribosylanthranilate isomerase [Desulfonauticus sp.]
MLVKVCGLRQAEEVKALVEMGVDLLGFIFYPQSPRYLAPQEAAQVMPFCSQGKRVGVFVNNRVEEIVNISEIARLDYVQLHGAQDLEFCKELHFLKLIKVMWPEKYTRAKDLERDLKLFAPWVEYFLFDAGGFGGGHGRVIKQGVWEQFLADYPIILAGGIGPHNIEQVLKYKPMGVDLNSGVEIAPGRKDLTKVKLVLQTIKELAC